MNIKKTIGLVTLPEEVILIVSINNSFITRMACSPFNYREFITGWLFNQGIINTLSDMENLTIDDNKENPRIWVTLRENASENLNNYNPVEISACSGGHIRDSLFNNLKKLERDYYIEVHKLISIMKKIFEREEMFKKHGGIHCSMLVDINKDNILVSMEDIGRSNSIDKVIGWGLINQLKLSDLAIFTTGRISSEMALKTYKAEIPCLVSLTTFTTKAFEIAQKTGMTLGGHILKPRPILVNI